MHLHASLGKLPRILPNPLGPEQLTFSIKDNDAHVWPEAI